MSSKALYEKNKWQAVYVGAEEGVITDNEPILRLKVPGGWLLQKFSNCGFSICFYPDPEYKWNPPPQSTP